MVVVMAVYVSLTSRTTSHEWMQTLETGATRMSEMIEAATHYGMLQNRKEDIHHAIRRIAQAPDVDGIRIYDKEGMIVFSADEAEIGQHVDMQAEACVICHESDESAELLQSAPTDVLARVFRNADGERILGLINPIRNSEECSGTDCHVVPEEQTILGVLDVKLSMAHSDESLAAMQREVMVATLVMALLLAGASVLFIYRLVRIPVRHLISGTRRIARGDLDSRIEVKMGSELGQLANAFNKMTGDLHLARQEITEWSQTLEQRILEKTEELKRAQQQIVQMEKLSSLGKMAATVAHELNNPLSGILAYAKLTSEELSEANAGQEFDEVLRYQALIQKESSRCGDVVRNLLLFSRSSGYELAEQSAKTIIERALMLVQHHLEMTEIRLVKDLGGQNDTITCDENQVQQAFVALFVNAVEAMPDGGILTVSCKSMADDVCIEVGDTGYGIPDEAQPQIFEPFFSTKDALGGVGLGLAVVYGIVQRHEGTIEVDSSREGGTTFRVRLPRCLEGREEAQTRQTG
jgi:two-component system NtrC family sensor kinase